MEYPDFIELPSDISLPTGVHLQVLYHLLERSELKATEPYHAVVDALSHPAQLLDPLNGCYFGLNETKQRICSCERPNYVVEHKVVWPRDRWAARFRYLPSITSPHVGCKGCGSRKPINELGWECPTHHAPLRSFMIGNIQSDWQLLYDLLISSPEIYRKASYYQAVNNHHPHASLAWLAKKRKHLVADRGGLLYPKAERKYLPPLLHRSRFGYRLTEAGVESQAAVRKVLEERGVLGYLDDFYRLRLDRLQPYIKQREAVEASRKVIVEEIVEGKMDEIWLADYRELWGYGWDGTWRSGQVR